MLGPTVLHSPEASRLTESCLFGSSRLLMLCHKVTQLPSSHPRGNQTTLHYTDSNKSSCFCFLMQRNQRSFSFVFLESLTQKITVTGLLQLIPPPFCLETCWTFQGTAGNFFLHLAEKKTSADWLRLLFDFLFLESRWYFPWHFSTGCCERVADLFQAEWKARPRSLLFQLQWLLGDGNATMMLLSDASPPLTSSRSDLVFILPFFIHS